MDVIHLLPDSVANQIAAGEVIQRPASCLKELVENALDAGASHIRIIVRDAGRTYIQVVDDGSGMSVTDARMAFERHATSKIRAAEDLYSLRTMGFRGEALPSICAVSQVEVQTRRAEDEVGTLLEIHGSEVVRQEPCQCPVGTNIRVKNLFYNVPVRRKFLKTDQTELRNLKTEFYHIALVYPSVRFTFVSQDEILHELAPGTEKQRIEQIFGHGTGHTYTSGMVDVDMKTDLVSVKGFIGKPELASRQAQQYFFVNGRFMRHPYFHKAVMTAYSGMLAVDYTPSYFIYFNIDPERIDVNIHPTKTEIKFADEQAVFQLLLSAVRASLGRFDLNPLLDFDQPGIEMPTEMNPNTSMPKVVVDPTYTPFRSSEYKAPSFPQTHSAEGWSKLYEPMPEKRDEVLLPDLIGIDLEAVGVFQYAERYILLPGPQGLLMVNQHRAHYAVLYDRYMEQLAQTEPLRQQVLFPEVLDLTTDEVGLVTQLLDDLRQIGFGLERLSPTSFSITAVPGLLGETSAVKALMDILSDVRETRSSVHSDWQHTIALSLARDSSIPYGKRLTEVEMRDLLSRLFNRSSYLVAPDGKKIIGVFTQDEINRKF